MDEVVGTDVITGPADLSASFTDDASAVDTVGAEPVDGLSEPESPEATELLGELNETGEETAADEQEADAAEEIPEEEAQPEAAVDELPDGVHAVDRNGKKEYRLNETRYQAFHGAHKQLREFSELAGEPMTKEAFEIRNNALLAENRLYGDMLSGDPESQGKVIQFFFDQAKEAMESGAVAGNPMVPFTQTFYQNLRSTDADAYAALRHDAAKDLIEEMYGEAAAKQSKGLFLSAGHIAKALGLSFKPEAEMPEFFAKRGEVDPVSAKDRQIQDLQAQLNGRNQQTAEQQFNAWRSETGRTIQAAIVDEAIMPALSSIADQGYWKTHPDAFKDLVVSRLNSSAQDAIKKDAGFGARVAELDKAAKRAVSEQRRGEIRAQIKQLYVNRAKLAAEASMGQVIKDANDRVKGQNAATHQRRQAAQNHRAPSGGSPVKRSLVPTQANDFEVATPANLRASLDRMLA